MKKNEKCKDNELQYTQFFYDWFLLLENKELNCTDILTLTVIVNLSKLTGVCTATNEYLVKEMHLSIATIKRSIKKLSDNGLITCTNLKDMKRTGRRNIVVSEHVNYYLQLNGKKKKSHLSIECGSQIDKCRLTNEEKQAQENDGQGSQMDDLRLKDENLNGENDINSLNNSHLKEKENKKENKKEKGLQSNPTHPADALSSHSFDEEEYSQNECSEEKIPITYDDEVLSKICIWINANESEKNILNKKLGTIDLLLRKIIVEEEIDYRSVDYNLLKVIYHIADKHKIYIRDGFKGLFLFNTINKYLHEQEIRSYVQSKETEYYKNFGFPPNDQKKLSNKEKKTLEKFVIDYVAVNDLQNQFDIFTSKEEKEEDIKRESRELAERYVEDWKKSEDLYDKMYGIIIKTLCNQINIKI